MGECGSCSPDDDARSSRFAVQTQNLMLLATVAQRHPWVRVLDGYEISHLRADAHPAADDFTRAGRASKRDKRRSGDDCLHYCVPGVPGCGKADHISGAF